MTIDAFGNTLDALGNIVSNSQPTYIDYFVPHSGGPGPLTNQGGGVPHYVANPNYRPPDSGTNGSNPAPPPPHLQFAFDTIGQVIFRTLGHVRVPLRMIWAQGINASGDVSVSPTLTFAAALSAPIDPLELGNVASIWDGADQVLGSGGAVIPDTWSVADGALLLASLLGTLLYPGDEAQEPAPLIVADKGAAVTNAFRGIRYIIFQDYPIRNGTPQLTVEYNRSNPGKSPKETIGAFGLAAGST